MELLRETGYTSVENVRAFQILQVISKIEEKDVSIQACELGEPVCKNGSDDVEGEFYFFFMIQFLLSSTTIFP